MVYSSDSYINSRDVEKEIEGLESDLEDFLSENNGYSMSDFESYAELQALRELRSQAEGYCDWLHGATLISENRFVEHVKEELMSNGTVIPSFIVPDWDATAEKYRQEYDYTEVDFEGTAFYVL